jgi:hypothetical protein
VQRYIYADSRLDSSVINTLGEQFKLVIKLYNYYMAGALINVSGLTDELDLCALCLNRPRLI